MTWSRSSRRRWFGQRCKTVAELAHRTLRRDFRSIDPRDARVVVVHAAPQVLPPLGERPSEHQGLGRRVIGDVTRLDDEPSRQSGDLETSTDQRHRAEPHVPNPPPGVHDRLHEQGHRLAPWSVSFIGRGRAQRTTTQQQVLGRRALHLLDGQLMTSIHGSGVGDQREQPGLDAEAVIARASGPVPAVSEGCCRHP